MGRLSWKEELKKFEGLEKEQKLFWLSSLQFSLTLLGRSTYVADSYAVRDPVLLRNINEFFHRTTDYQMKLLDPSIGSMSAADAAAMIEESRHALGVNGEFILQTMCLSNTG